MYWVHNRITRGRFKPKWIFKCDDDNLVDIYKFEKYLLDLEEQVQTEAQSNKIFCYVRDDAVPMRPGLNAVKGSSHIILIFEFTRKYVLRRYFLAPLGEPVYGRSPGMIQIFFTYETYATNYVNSNIL